MAQGGVTERTQIMESYPPMPLLEQDERDYIADVLEAAMKGNGYDEHALQDVILLLGGEFGVYTARTVFPVLCQAFAQHQWEREGVQVSLYASWIVYRSIYVLHEHLSAEKFFSRGSEEDLCDMARAVTCRLSRQFPLNEDIAFSFVSLLDLRETPFPSFCQEQFMLVVNIISTFDPESGVVLNACAVLKLWYTSLLETQSKEVYLENCKDAARALTRAITKCSKKLTGDFPNEVKSLHSCALYSCVVLFELFHRGDDCVAPTIQTIEKLCRVRSALPAAVLLLETLSCYRVHSQTLKESLLVCEFLHDACFDMQRLKMQIPEHIAVSLSATFCNLVVNEGGKQSHDRFLQRLFKGRPLFAVLALGTVYEKNAVIAENMVRVSMALLHYADKKGMPKKDVAPENFNRFLVGWVQLGKDTGEGGGESRHFWFAKNEQGGVCGVRKKLKVDGNHVSMWFSVVRDTSISG